MNAPAKVAAKKADDTNTALWDALGRTDPKHTKGFNRAGGFKGTALKPMWVLHRLTEQFGPVGHGWGYDKPTFQVVEAAGEILVYATVGAWVGSNLDREGEPVRFYGVGGDKVLTKRQSGTFADDEAFKKSFTDALMNAFKHLGVGADIHMGQFDDSKYVAAVAREFEEEASDGEQVNAHSKSSRGLDGPITSKAKLHEALCHYQREIARCGDDETLTAFIEMDKDYVAFVNQCERDAPHYLHGGEPAPPEFVGLFDQIKNKRDQFAMEEMG